MAFALLPGSLCLRAQGRAERFVLRFASPQAEAEAESSVGAQIAGLLPLAQALPADPAANTWLVLVGMPATPSAPGGR